MWNFVKLRQRNFIQILIFQAFLIECPTSNSFLRLFSPYLSCVSENLELFQRGLSNLQLIWKLTLMKLCLIRYIFRFLINPAIFFKKLVIKNVTNIPRIERISKWSNIKLLHLKLEFKTFNQYFSFNSGSGKTGRKIAI